MCQDWVLPCLDTLYTAISWMCNCEADIVSQPEYIPPSSMGYAFPPTAGEAICLRCGEVVNLQCPTFSGRVPQHRADRQYLSATKKETGDNDRIPLPSFTPIMFPITPEVSLSVTTHPRHWRAQFDCLDSNPIHILTVCLKGHSCSFSGGCAAQARLLRCFSAFCLFLRLADGKAPHLRSGNPRGRSR